MHDPWIHFGILTATLLVVLWLMRYRSMVRIVAAAAVLIGMLSAEINILHVAQVRATEPSPIRVVVADADEVIRQVKLREWLESSDGVVFSTSRPRRQSVWPEGMGRNPIAFIRFRYNGEGWDDGMDEASRADMNFLDRFNKVTKLKVARNPESRTFGQLKNFDKGFQPPFIYMTGSRSINYNANDAKILREYLLDGGMLFADAGSPEWAHSFRGFIGSVMPEKQIVQIANDDPLYQASFVFPNGAPPLWHHGGNRALGIKHKGRWCVFFHPGDVNDAWKTGHGGVNKQIADQAYQLGINVVSYAYTHYLEETKKHRK